MIQIQTTVTQARKHTRTQEKQHLDAKCPHVISEGMCVAERHLLGHVTNTLKSDKAHIVMVHNVPVTSE